MNSAIHSHGRMTSLGNLLKDCRFEWTDVCHRPFQELKDKLSIYPVLRPPDWDKPFHVFCDARNITVGNALCQSTGKKDKNQPISILASN
jgi:hypothetical protein